MQVGSSGAKHARRKLQGPANWNVFYLILFFKLLHTTYNDLKI